MKRMFIFSIFTIFMLPTAIVLADYGDDLKKREEKKLEENHKNQSLQPSGTSPAPTYDPSATTGNLKTPTGIDSSDKSGNPTPTTEQRK